MRILSEVTYPVFPISKYGVIFREFDKVFVDMSSGRYILDDTKYSGNLAIRRLHILHDIKYRKENSYEYTPIYKLRKAIRSEDQLLVNLSKDSKFIDSKGKIYSHKPTTFFKLVYRKVDRVLLRENGESLLFIEGVSQPIKLKRSIPDNLGNIYAGLLQLAGRVVLYELTRVKKPDTRRKL
jgi:hypothetical protein